MSKIPKVDPNVIKNLILSTFKKETFMKEFESVVKEAKSTYAFILRREVSGDTPKPRPMKYPYTFTAKFVQFPWVFHFNNSWFYRYYFYGVLVCIPIFWKIQRAACSKANQESWEMTKHQTHENRAAALRQRHARGIYLP